MRIFVRSRWAYRSVNRVVSGIFEYFPKLCVTTELENWVYITRYCLLQNTKILRTLVIPDQSAIG